MAARAKPPRPSPRASSGDVDPNGDILDCRPLLSDELKERLGRAIVGPPRLRRDQLRAVSELLGRRLA